MSYLNVRGDEYDVVMPPDVITLEEAERAGRAKKTRTLLIALGAIAGVYLLTQTRRKRRR